MSNVPSLEPELQYALVADYFTVDQAYKPIVVGVFDIVIILPGAPLRVPRHFVVASVAAPVIVGTEHVVEIRCVDADSKPVPGLPTPKMPLRFSLTPARNLRALVAAEFASYELPALGDYFYELYVDERQVGTTSYSVVAAQTVQFKKDG